MGRIAEALKRAQEERGRRAMQNTSGADDSVIAGGPSPSDVSEQFSPEDLTDMLRPPSLRESPLASELPALSSAALPAERVPPIVVAFHEPSSELAEKYRAVRTRLLTSNSEYRPRIYGVSSAWPGEGKTVSTANLAFSLSELRHLQVVMVDFDLRNRGLSRTFQAEDLPGVAEILRGEKTLTEVCLSVARRNLFFIPGGQVNDSSLTELLTGGRASSLAKELRERFHYSLLDTSAIDPYADVGLIGGLCHSLMLVIRMNRTPEPVLQKCVKSLEANNIALAGGILVGDLSKMALYEGHGDFGTSF